MARILTGIGDDGQALASDTCAKLLAVPAALGSACPLPEVTQSALDTQLADERQLFLQGAMLRNHRYFEAEMEKLDLWAEDLKENLECEIKEFGRLIADAKREQHKAASLPESLQWHKKVKELEKSRQEKRKTLFEAQDQIDADKDRLIGEIEARLKQQTEEEEVFTIRWRVQ